MTRRERVARALSHQPVDIVPYHIGFTVPARKKMAEFYGNDDFEAGIDNHLAVSPCVRVEWGKHDEHGIYVDEFGLHWNRKSDPDIGMPLACLTRENLDTFPWPDPKSPGRFDGLVRARKENPDRYLVMAVDFSLFERAWAMVGMEEFLASMLADKPFVAALLDRIVQFNVGLVEAGLAACPEVDAVYFGDDFGTQNGLMMGPKPWHELLEPRLARQYAAVKARGKKVFIHSCGKVDSLFDELVRLGVDCFNPFQPEVVDVFAIKQRYAGRLAFFGGISTQRLLPFGSPSQVREEVTQLLERLGKSGGYIAAPAHAIPGDAPAENIHAMLDVLKNQRV